MPGAEVKFYVAFFKAINKTAECGMLAVVMMNIEVFWNTGPSPASSSYRGSEKLDATIFSVPAVFLDRTRLLPKFGYYLQIDA